MGMKRGKKMLVDKFDLRAGNVVSGREVLANIAPVFNWPAAPGSASDTRFAQVRCSCRKYLYLQTRCLYFNG